MPVNTKHRFLISPEPENQFVLISILKRPWARRRTRAPSCAPKIPSFGPRGVSRNSLSPNCVAFTESAPNRNEQKFDVPRSARISRQDFRFGGRQIPL